MHYLLLTSYSVIIVDENDYTNDAKLFLFYKKTRTNQAVQAIQNNYRFLSITKIILLVVLLVLLIQLLRLLLLVHLLGILFPAPLSMHARRLPGAIAATEHNGGRPSPRAGATVTRVVLLLLLPLLLPLLV